MNLTLERQEFGSNGIFGEIKDEWSGLLFCSAEHAYQNENGLFVPKLSNGTYVCLRGMHELESMEAPFEAFEIKNVPPFLGREVSGILFHVLNYPQTESEGCVGVGQYFVNNNMITNSQSAFKQFMSLQDGIETFQLTVR